MILLHHLARTGGTLISRCLASMDGVCLLSEINPLGTPFFNPLRQAADWFRLVTPDEVSDLRVDDPSAFSRSIELIDQRAKQRNKTLVVRDWSHLDWIGFPFNQPPMQSSWDGIADNAIRVATVRHPLDQYLSCRRLTVLNKAWDEGNYWRGVRQFAESIQTIPWFRYEDFLVAPDHVLRQICGVMSVEYDALWQSRWRDYKTITGDSIRRDNERIAAKPRSMVTLDVWKSLRKNGDFAATVEILGYSMPEPLRRAETCRSISEPIQSNGASQILLSWDDEVVNRRTAVAEDRGSIDAGLQLAEALCWTGQTDEAADLLLKIAANCESSTVEVQIQTLLLTSRTLDKAGRKFEAIEPRRRLAQLTPENRDNLFQLSLLLVGIGEVDEAIAYSQRLLQMDRHNDGAAANHLLYINYSDRYSASEIAKEHFRLGMRFSEREEKLALRVRDARDRIRLGYLASDFYTHPVGKIILPILQAHDRTRFDIRIYHDGRKTDQQTQAIRQCVDVFNHTHGKGDNELVDTIRRDQLDTLIDLGGYTGGGNRLRVLARRVAPVQISFLGYPNTSALQTIDYHLTDRYADPPGVTEQFYGERLVWLQHAHLAWRPYPIAKSIVVEPSGIPTLGIFNNLAKISSSAINAYASILKQVPEARLLMKYGDRYGVPMVRDRFRHRFAAAGVLPDRIGFRSRAETLEEHLRTMASVDLALDSFPYQGTMTSLECLSVGTPILSCCGSYYAHRATSAMMIRLGLDELVAEDPAEYVEIATQLLQDIPLLRSLRSDVRRRFYSSPLSDPQGLTKELEQKVLLWKQAA